MGLTKQQLEALNVSSFPNNNAGAITPDILRQYNAATITNTVNQDTYTTDSASFDSRILAVDDSLVTTASFNAYTQSTNLFTASISTSVGLLQTFSGSEYKSDSSSFDTRINSFASSSIPAGTVSSSAQISELGFATTASVNTLSSSIFQTDTTQSTNLTNLSSSLFQTDTTQSFQISANALTASNATTALSQSLYFTDTTQSVNLTNLSSSIAQTDFTQSTKINSLTALTASTAFTNVNNSFSGTQSFVNVTVSGTASVAFLNVTYQSSSVIYSSGSNILGDEANVDTQTLIGRVIASGSLEVTGSLKVTSDISSSTLNGIGNVTLYSASVAASITSSTANVTILSQSLYFTDTTQSANLTNLSSSIAQTDFTQSYQIVANALTASTALTNYSSSQSTLNNTLSSSIATNSSSVGLLQTFSGSQYKTDSASFDSRILAITSSGGNINTASFATTGSNTFIGNQTITGSLAISSSLQYDVTIEGQLLVTQSNQFASGATVRANIVVAGPVAGTAGGSRSGSVTITPSTIAIIKGTNNTSIAPTGINVFGADLGNLLQATNTAQYTITAYGTGIDNEINLYADLTKTAFRDWDNTLSDYSEWLTLAPNDGITPPAPQFKRGLGVTGSAIFTELTGSLGAYSASVDSRINSIQTIGYVTTSSFNAFTQSTNDFTASITSSYNATSESYNALSSSFVAVSASALSHATTGSNTFNGNQVINGVLQVSSSATYDIDVTGSIQANTTMRVSSSTGITTIQSSTITVASGSAIASLGKNVISHTSSSNSIGIIAGAGTAPFTGATNASILVSSGSTAFYYPIQFQAGTSYTDGRVTIITPLVVSSSLFVSGATNFTELTGSLASFSASVDSRILAATINTSSFATTGSNTFIGTEIITGSLIITGSVATPPIALTITSQTASIDFSKGSIYTLTLVSGSATYITASNLVPGQTANLLVTQTAALSGSIVWASAFKFPSGSSYTGSVISNGIDLISFVTVNNSTIYSVGAKNLI